MSMNHRQSYEGKKRKPLKAIRDFCRYCMNDDPELIRGCPSKDCTLYPLRSGTLLTGLDLRPLQAIKTYCAKECLPAEHPAGCTANVTYLGHDPCPLWPFRLGANPNYSPETREALRARAMEHGFRPRAERLEALEGAEEVARL